MAKFWVPETPYPVVRPTTVSVCMPLKGYGGLNQHDRGLVAELKLSSSQTANWSANPEVVWDQADIDPYGSYDSGNGRWAVPAELDGHLLLAQGHAYMTALSGGGTEFVDVIWKNSGGTIQVFNRSLVQYGPTSQSEYYENTIAAHVASEGDYVVMRPDAGTDTSSTLQASIYTYMRVFDLGVLQAGVPGAAENKAHSVYLNDTADLTGINYTAFTFLPYDTALQDTEGTLFDPCVSETRITVPAALDGWDFMHWAFYDLTAATDEGQFGVFHRNSSNTTLSGVRRYLQPNAIDTGGNRFRETQFHMGRVSEGDYLSPWIDLFPLDTSHNHLRTSTVRPYSHAVFFPPVVV